MNRSRINLNFLRITSSCWLLLAGAVWAQEKLPLYWSIEKSGQHAGYLLGTIHSEDSRVLEYTGSFLEALQGSQFFAMELVPDLPTLARLGEMLMLPDDTNLPALVGDERYNRIIEALAVYGMPASHISRMKPWAVMMTLSFPPPKTGFFMDFSLSLRASGAGVKVLGLETLDQQLQFLEEMSVAQQIDLLDEAIDGLDQVQEVHDKMVDIYLQGDLRALQAETELQLRELDEATRNQFMSEGIFARNQRMAERLLEYLQDGSVFTAVGALHLPGPQGLIALLSNAGYELQPVPLPFLAVETATPEF